MELRVRRKDSEPSPSHPSGTRATIFQSGAAPGFGELVCYEQGPRVFALPVGQRWRTLRQRGLMANLVVFRTEESAYAADPAVAPLRVGHSMLPATLSHWAPAVALHVRTAPKHGRALLDGSAVPVPRRLRIARSLRAVARTRRGAPKLRLTSFPALAD